MNISYRVQITAHRAVFEDFVAWSSR